MPSGLLTMSEQEIERTTIIKQVAEKQLKQSSGAKLLRLSTRQIKRLVKAYRRYGAAGLISKHRGRVSNRFRGNTFKEEIKNLVSEHYHDFGPTFAAEKLLEIHGLKISKERLRHWMIEWSLWHPKKIRMMIHQTRERRACFGELIQIDGSHHNWFEGRRPKCCLLVFIDDATSKLVGLRFENSETTAGYFKLFREYIECYGKPLSVYSDKDSIFRINREGCDDKETQFKRAMRELDIESICANSPQAKGRVERANNTLQKRLVRELRLRKINDIESANKYLPKFIDDYNRRFAKSDRDSVDMHRSYLPFKEILDLIFSFKEERKISKNLEVCYGIYLYQIKTANAGRRLQHKKITVCEGLNGEVTLLYEGRKLEYTVIKKEKRAAEIIPLKQVDERLDGRGYHSRHIPTKSHPWRHMPIGKAAHNTR